MATHPRLPLGDWPTPVRLMERVSERLGCEVWIKDEEAAGAYGGNKVRKLEYILGRSRADATEKLVAYGAGSSTWCAAVAWHGTKMGFDVTLGLGGPGFVDLNDLYRRLGVPVVSLPRLAAIPAAAAAARAKAGRGARTLPAGGSGIPGDIGSAGAGLEIGDAVAVGVVPRPEAVFVPAGTAGTAAGLAAGLGAHDLPVPVVAVRVTPRPEGTDWLLRRRLKKLVPVLGKELGKNVVAAPVISESGFFGDAYGKPTGDAMEAMALASEDGVTLDVVYACKAFAALVEYSKTSNGPLLFLLTSPGPPPGT